MVVYKGNGEMSVTPESKDVFSRTALYATWVRVGANRINLERILESLLMETGCTSI